MSPDFAIFRMVSPRPTAFTLSTKFVMNEPKTVQIRIDWLLYALTVRSYLAASSASSSLKQRVQASIVV
jgi:hypothetical protein